MLHRLGYVGVPVSKLTPEDKRLAKALLIIHVRASLEAAKTHSRDPNMGDEDEEASVHYEDLCNYALDVLLPRVEKLLNKHPKQLNTAPNGNA